MGRALSLPREVADQFDQRDDRVGDDRELSGPVESEAMAFVRLHAKAPAFLALMNLSDCPSRAPESSVVRMYLVGVFKVLSPSERVGVPACTGVT
jgi:hypothetical protein